MGNEAFFHKPLSCCFCIWLRLAWYLIFSQLFESSFGIYCWVWFCLVRWLICSQFAEVQTLVSPFRSNPGSDHCSLFNFSSSRLFCTSSSSRMINCFVSNLSSFTYLTSYLYVYIYWSNPTWLRNSCSFSNLPRYRYLFGAFASDSTWLRTWSLFNFSNSRLNNLPIVNLSRFTCISSYL